MRIDDHFDKFDEFRSRIGMLEGLIRELIADGCEHAVGCCDDKHCFFCNAWIDTDRFGKPYEEHLLECPYIRAKRVVG